MRAGPALPKEQALLVSRRSNSAKDLLKEELRFGTKAHKWITQQGPDPWAADAFDCPDPLVTFLENFTVLCKAKKWGRSNKAATGVWGLFNALHAATDQFRQACHTIKTMQADHDRELTALREARDTEIQTLNKAHDKELAALKEIKHIEIQTLHKDHDQKIKEKDVEIDILKKEHGKEIQTQVQEITALTRDNLALLVTSRTHQAAADELRETRQLLNKRDQEISNLTEQLNDTQSAAHFMAKENKTKIQEADHSACLQEIATLKRQFAMQKAIVASIHPEGLLNFSDYESPIEPEVPEDAMATSPLNPEWEEAAPVNPVRVRQVETTGPRNTVVRKEVLERTCGPI
uniref:Uncharacterized protein n=1 Tax=Sphaerodactylus townsendi TaxID=933632 RepID=A0ACB8E7Q6_9SAUR